MLTHRGNNPWSETLEGLHTPAWWTGLRLAAAEGWNTIYRVKLRIRDSEQAGFPFAARECEWTQVSNDWHPLPFPIPASMATTMGLELYVRPTDNAPPSLITSVKIAFQEMPALRDNDRYLFCDHDGAPVHVWDGRHRAWGTPEEGFQPQWRQLHVVVPTMKWLRHMPWGDQPFCIHAWDERVPLRPQPQT